MTGASAYAVYRDGAQVALVSGQAFDEALGDGTYRYRVRSSNGYNLGPASDAVDVTVDRTPPDAPAGLTGPARTSPPPELSWDAVTGASSYALYRDGTPVWSGAAVSATDGAAPEGTLSYVVTALDAAGNESVPSAAVVVERKSAAPAAPAGLHVLHAPSALPVQIAWTAADGVSYHVFRDGSEVGTADGSATFADAGAADGTSIYTVTAEDLFGNVSAPSDPLSVRIFATPPATPPAPTAAAIVNAGPEISSSAPAAPDTTYRLLRDGTEVATFTGPDSFTDTLAPDGSHDYTLVAFDPAGNTSAPSAPATVLVDRQAPGAPVLDRPESPAVGLVDLVFSGDADTSLFRIVRDGHPLAETASSPFSDAPASGAHDYQVFAIDAAGNVSPGSSTYTVDFSVTPDGAPAGFVATVAHSDVALSWDPVAAARGYVVYRDGTEIGRPSTPGLTDTGLADGSYSYAVVALFRASLTSPPAQASVTVDTVAPAAPTGLTADSPTNGTPKLAWQGPGDAAAYLVVADGGAAQRVSTPSFTDGGAGEGTHTYDVRTVDAAGNVSAAAGVSVVVDRTPPAAPADVAADASPTNGAPALTWSAVDGAVRYDLLRDGDVVGSTSGTSLADTAVALDGTFSYTVLAVDAAGNASAPSAPVTVTVDTGAPATPDGLAAGSPTNAPPALTWNAAAGASRYRIYRDGAHVGTTATPGFVDTAAPDGAFAYTVVAVDDAGNTSAASDPLAVELDTVAPDVPQVGAVISPTNAQPHLDWAPAAGATAYTVIRDGVRFAASGTSFTDHVSADGRYTYLVEARDAAGNTATSAPVEITFKTAAPGVPDGLAADSPTRADPVLTWNGVDGAVGYTVYRDGDPVATTDQARYVDAAPPEGSHDYAVSATDDAANESARSQSVTVVVDRTPPAAPTGLAATSPTAQAPVVTFDAVSDAVSYHLLRDGSVVAAGAATTFTDPAVPADGSHDYAVVAIDAAGNASVPSQALAVVVDTTAPDVPADLAATSPTRLAPALTWTAVAGAVGYVVYRDGAGIGSPADPAFSDGNDPGDGTARYAVAARDAAGNLSAPSAEVAVVIDRTAPAAPDAPTAAADPTAAAPSLTWPSVAGAVLYEVQRDGAAIGETALTSFGDAGLADDGTVAYRLVAIDAAGNRSAPSGATAVTLDTTAPPAPVLDPPQSPTNALPHLAWTAGGGAASFVVLRDAAPVGETAGRQFDDEPGADGTFTYRVIARDVAGNASAPSDPVTVDYRTAPPGVPSGLRAATPTRVAPDLLWDAVTGATEYVVVRDGAEVGRTPVTEFTDAADVPEGDHVYVTRAVDGAGNLSQPSDPVTVTVDRTPPDAPSGFALDPLLASPPVLTWTGPSDAAGWIVRRDGDVIAADGSSPLTDAAATDGAHEYTVVAVDAAGNHSLPATASTVLDTAAPATPVGLRADSSPTATAPVLSWDGVATADGYVVLRDGVPVGSPAGASFTDAADVAEGAHAYAVAAVDAAGNTSAPSDPVAVVVDRTAPAAPAPAGDSPTAADPVVAWPAVTDAQDYEISRDGSPIGTTAGLGFTDSHADPGTHAYTVVAIDAAGNRSAPGGPADIVVDRTAPAAPSATAPSPTADQPIISWPAVAGAARFRVLRDGDVAGDVTGTSFRDTLSHDGTHTYQVVAYDDAGNASQPSPDVTVVYDTTPPDAPQHLTGDSPTRTSPALHWDAVSDAARYVVYRDGQAIAESSDTSFADTALADDGHHAYEVAARDAAGNESLRSDAVSILFRAGAPAAVTGLDAASPTHDAPRLTWTPIDNVQGYVVRRDGTEIGQPTTAAFTDPILPVDGSHVYTVAAIGASGLEGDPSAPLEVVVDTHPPETTLGAHPEGTTGPDVIVAFTVSADAVRAECRVDTDAYATCASPFAASHLGTGDHTIAVRAVDDAGNVDATPAEVAWTVDATPPDAPLLTATPDVDQPLGSGRGRVFVHVAPPADATRLVVRRGSVVVLDGPPSDIDDAGLADSTHYQYTAIAYDAVGNASAPATASADTPDRTAPATPPAPTGTGYPLHVQWQPEPGTTFSLSRDNAVIAQTRDTALVDADATDTAAPPAPATPLITDNGSHVTIGWTAVDDTGTTYHYAVRGDDDAGNAGGASPEAGLVATSGLAGYRVLVDGAVVATGGPDATSADLAGLSGNLAHRVQVVAFDAAGNASDPSAAATVGHDVAPAAPTGLAGLTPTRTSPAFSWTAVDGATGYVVFRDGTEIARTDAVHYTDADATADGSYVYTVAAFTPVLTGDPAGPLTIVIDTTPPRTTILDGPTGVARPTVTFDLGPAEPGTTFTCSIDDGATASCPSSWTLSDLTSGQHTVTITATDAAGNVDPTPLVEAFSVDATPPDPASLTAVADPALPLNSSLGRVAVDAQPGAGGTHVVVTEGQRLVLDSAGGSITDDVPDGATFTYTAVTYDDAGNASDPVSATVTTPDRTPPAPPVITSATGDPVSVVFTGDAGATFSIERDGTTVDTTTARTYADPAAVDAAAPDVPVGLVADQVTDTGFRLRWTGAADAGTGYVYRITATDAAGNTSEPSGAASAVALSGTARYRVRVDGAPAADVTGLSATLAGFAPGSTHGVTIEAVDGDGNASSASDPIQVELGSSSGAPPPSAVITPRPAYVRPGTGVDLRVAVSGGTPPTMDVRWAFDDGSHDTGAQVSHTFHTTGVHQVTATARDAGGGVVTTTALVIVDDTAPTVRLGRKLVGGILLAAHDDLAGVATLRVSERGRSRSVPIARPALQLADGVHTLIVTAVDRAGNSRVVTFHVVIDTHGPRVRIRLPYFATTKTAPVAITATDISGVRRVTIDGKAVRQRATVSTGSRHVLVATDRAGNERRVVFRIASARPIASLTDPALDGARHDQLWYNTGLETGMRLYLLQVAEQRLSALGYLPASFAPTDHYTPRVLAAVRRFQVAKHVATSGAPTGTIGPETKAALDRAISVLHTIRAG